MYLRVSGVDILPYIKKGGLKWTKSDIDAPNSGRTMDGVMHRGRVASKIRLDLSFIAMGSADVRKVLQALSPEVFIVEYQDPLFGDRSVYMYAGNVTAALDLVYDIDSQTWGEFTVPLIER